MVVLARLVVDGALVARVVVRGVEPVVSGCVVAAVVSVAAGTVGSGEEFSVGAGGSLGEGSGEGAVVAGETTIAGEVLSGSVGCASWNNSPAVSSPAAPMPTRVRVRRSRSDFIMLLLPNDSSEPHEDEEWRRSS